MPNQFGDLIRKFPRMHKGHLEWQCLCRCGNLKYIRDEHLRSGASTSCGLCNYNLKHPQAHKSWDSMNQRCNNPNAPDYPRYGGRGITVCKEWARFIDFLDDMGDPPTDAITGDRYTLERKENDKGYYKDNCIWASKREQNNNRANTLAPHIFRYSNGNKRRD